MNIGDVSTRSGLPAKTIRYYEDIGLVSPLRGTNGYRTYCNNELHKLSFMCRARSLGFTIEDCRTLIDLYDDETRESADVKRVANEHLEQIKTKISGLEAMRATLSHLINECAGDHRPDCPILKDLSGAFAH